MVFPSASINSFLIVSSPLERMQLAFKMRKENGYIKEHAFNLQQKNEQLCDKSCNFAYCCQNNIFRNYEAMFITTSICLLKMNKRKPKIIITYLIWCHKMLTCRAPQTPRFSKQNFILSCNRLSCFVVLRRL